MGWVNSKDFDEAVAGRETEVLDAMGNDPVGKPATSIILQVDRPKARFYVHFSAPCPEKDIVKAAGFRFDGSSSTWIGCSTEALKLMNNGGVQVSESAAEMIREAREEAVKAEGKKIANIAASAAQDADIVIPRGQGAVDARHDYLPYQRAGIAYAVGKPATLIADEMGLGKTVQAVGISNLDPSCRRVLVVCPSSLKKNWCREWLKWCAKGLTVGIAEGSKALPDADVVIVNYDILHKFRSHVDAVAWDLLVADECHLAKNPKSRRTAALLGRKGKKPEERVEPVQARRVVLLTGTPILNRPVELFPLLQRIDPTGLGSDYWHFVRRYCDATRGRFGWDVSGASNLQELQQRLRGSVMVRRLKGDVLTELPPKRRQLITLDRAETRELKAAITALEKRDAEHADRIAKLEAEAEMAKALGTDCYLAAAAKIGTARKVAFEEMSKARHELAIAKAPVVSERIAELLNDDEDMKIVVMAHHADVVDLLRASLGKYGVAEVSGRTPVGARQGECDRFQNDGSCRVFVGTIKAAGVGLTLTAAHVVAFVELDWVPGNISQAEDRCHRIGQKDSVLVWHFVVENSLDSRMVALLVSKQEIANKALNNLDPEAVVADDVSIDDFEVVSDAQIAAEEALLAANADAREQVAAEGCARMDSERKIRRASQKVAQRVDSDEGARQLRDIGAHRFLDDAAPRLRDDGARIVGLAG